MAFFRKKPVVIEAIQWTGDNYADIYKMAAKENTGLEIGLDKKLRIHTLEGVMEALCGDFIIKGVKGEMYPCKAEIFVATYEPYSSMMCQHQRPAGMCPYCAGVSKC